MIADLLMSTVLDYVYNYKKYILETVIWCIEMSVTILMSWKKWVYKKHCVLRGNEGQSNRKLEKKWRRYHNLFSELACGALRSIFPKFGQVVVNTLRPRQNGRHFPDDIFKWIFLNEDVWIPIKISMKFVPQGPINKIPALVQIMAWRRSGDKPLSEPMMVSSLTHICVTRPQWVKSMISPIASLKIHIPIHLSIIPLLTVFRLRQSQ